VTGVKVVEDDSRTGPIEQRPDRDVGVGVHCGESEVWAMDLYRAFLD
jgi:hypothetical protein